MARWQMESLSVKRNGSEGEAALFLPPVDERVWLTFLARGNPAPLLDQLAVSLFTRDVEEDPIMQF